MIYSSAGKDKGDRNRTLWLGGDGDYVEIAHSEELNSIDSQVTIEAWIKPTAFSRTRAALPK